MFCRRAAAPCRCAECRPNAPTVNSLQAAAASQRQWHHLVARLENLGDNNRTCLVRSVAGRLGGACPTPAATSTPHWPPRWRPGWTVWTTRCPQPTACDETCTSALPRLLPMHPPCPAARDLHAALDALEADAALREAVAMPSASSFWPSSATSGRPAQHVSAWELARYADAFWVSGCHNPLIHGSGCAESPPHHEPHPASHQGLCMTKLAWVAAGGVPAGNPAFGQAVANAPTDMVRLTDSERAYLSAHNPIKLCVDPTGGRLR